ncbi:agmatinase family protein [Salinithrix halophila]|uniref:Agmatinase family protein n=1 Tax=Salinithrix halophila TaxID=1485204 RepID=A0ABV8JIN2_9BACL
MSNQAKKNTGYPYPMLNPPPFRWQAEPDLPEPKVHEWIRTLEPSAAHDTDWSRIDAAILGVPLSRSSISASAASETPEEFRRAWRSFTPYNLEEDIDLTPLSVVDLGDVRQHVTDISRCHQSIREAAATMQRHHPSTLPILIGGDHSITAMSIMGIKDTRPEKSIGLLQLDTHFDLRSLEEFGPANGTPVRNLIESGSLRGSDVWNIGLHGFFNARSLRDYADRAGVNWITMKEARRIGLETAVHSALTQLEKKVDTIYLTVDMDVLDLACAPGTPAGAPGGMRTEELFEAVRIAGTHPRVRGMDIVCLDPRRDINQITIKTGVHVLLSFLTGFMQRDKA